MPPQPDPPATAGESLPIRRLSKPGASRKPAILLPRQLGRFSPWRTQSWSTTVPERRRNASPSSGAPAWRSVFGDPEDRLCDLLPPEAFPTPADIRPDPELRRRGGIPDEETGPDSHAVYWRFFSSCAGWPVPPTPREFYDAIREENPSRRQRAILRAWFREATNSEILWGWLEEAYTWPILVAAIHRIGYRRNALNHYLNGFAKRRNRAS